MGVFAAKTERPIQPVEETVVSIDIAVDLELRKERVGAVVHRAAEALFVGQALGTAMLDGTAKCQPIQPIVVGLFPRRNAHPAHDFGLIRGSAGEKPLSIEKAQPVLDHTAAQFTVSVKAGSPERPPGSRMD